MGLDKIGKYRVIAKIAEGAMGEVYRAHDPLLNRQVAIKTIAPALGRDAEFRRRFEREAQAAAQLNHPHIVTVFDFGEEGGVTYMAMELLEGRDLRETLTAGAPATLRGKLDLMQQICDGVAFAHGKGIVHRDLKPGNVHIQPNGQAKVLDFGLARVGQSDITQAGTIMGTPHYMSPEQVRGQKADARSDVFALGAIFYEVLTGRRPFGDDSPERVFQRIIGEEPPPIRDLAPRTPDVVAALVQRALDKDPADRFADAGAMAATLRRIQESLPSTLAQEGTGPAPFDIAEETLLTEGGATHTLAAVAGATALAPDPMGQQETLVSTTARPSVTAVGAATRIDSRRRLVWSGVGLLLVVAVGTAAWLALRRESAPLTSGEAAEESVGILTDALVSSQVELAREDLHNRDYEAAVERAERALELSPGHPDAQEVLALARTTLEERDAAVQSARAAFEAGDLEKATQSLSQVMSLDPRHPVVNELSGALNERFRQEAEGARDQARRARSAAEAERAGEVETFRVASGLEREAGALFGQKEYTSAAQKWIEARDAFESARRTARIARATPPPTPVAAAPTPTPSVARVATPPPRPPAPPPTTVPSRAGASGASVTPDPAETASARVASAAVPATPEPTPVVVATPDPRAAVRQVLADYERVFESKDLDLYRSIKLVVSSKEEEGLRKTFEQIDEQQLDLTIHEVELVGDDRAVVRTSRHDVLNGDARPPMKQVFRLVRDGDRWRIESFEFPR